MLSLVAEIIAMLILNSRNNVSLDAGTKIRITNITKPNIKLKLAAPIFDFYTLFPNIKVILNNDRTKNNKIIVYPPKNHNIITNNKEDIRCFTGRFI